MKGLQIVHINVRSLLPKIDSIRHGMVGSNIDVLCVTESWLHELIGDNSISKDGYMVYVEMIEVIVGAGGGTCIYINDRLKYTQSSNRINDKDIELQKITLLGNS